MRPRRRITASSLAALRHATHVSAPLPFIGRVVVRFGARASPIHVRGPALLGSRLRIPRARALGIDQIIGERAWRSAEFLGEPYEKAFGPADVAEPIHVFVLDHFAADKLRAVLTEPGEGAVEVVDGEHHA